MSNVFKFPESKIVREIPPNVEEVEKIKTKGKQNYADGMAEDLAVFMLTELENFGVDTTPIEFQKDFIFLTDVIRCAIYRSMGLEHGLHSFIDEHVEIVDRRDKILIDEEVEEDNNE